MDGHDHLLLLGTLPLHPGLEQLDGAVLARRAQRERRETQVVAGLAVAAALGIGIIGGMAPTSGTGAGAGTAMPFGPPVALTPLIALGRG